MANNNLDLNGYQSIEKESGLPYYSILGIDYDLWIAPFKFAVSFLPNDVEAHNILEIGSGQGGLSLYFAARGCDVICSDINPGYLESAHAYHVAMGYTSRILYKTMDILASDFSSEVFDIICFKSTLGAINDDKSQRQALSEIHRLLKPGGYLCFLENLRGDSLSGFYRRIFLPWGKRWNYITISKMREYLNDFAEFKMASFGYLAPFLAKILRKLTATGMVLDRLLNNNVLSEHRHILACYAIKGKNLS